MDEQQTPVTYQPDPDSSQLAAKVIRDKVARVYTDEPDALQEEREAEQATKRSKHQQFMYELSTSGKDLAAVQTEWHNYYLSLTDSERHQVWREFYASQSSVTQAHAQAAGDTEQQQAKHKHQVVKTRARSKPMRHLQDLRSPEAIQATIRETVTGNGKLGIKHHLQSLLFGLGMGTLVVIVFLFSFFNEVIIAPFIQPSRVAAATPIIVNANNTAATSAPQIIIPKINAEIPVGYSETSTNESSIENDLQSGVVHYPTTVLPGQNGNAAFFGHSSNNIFSPGNYKFAFVLLHLLVPGDTFYLNYNKTTYVYKVISKNVVDPSDVGVLGPVAGQTATATLITCDPPGTSLRRLIIVGQQISPAVTANATPAVGTAVAGVSAPKAGLPGNGPTLLNRFSHTVIGKAITVLILAAALWFVIRWVRRPLLKLRQV